jgi:hypothetical protein
MPASQLGDSITGFDGAVRVETCSVCGRMPADRFRFRANSGFVLVRQMREFAGPLCSTCATGMFRDMQAHNITRGPWGLFSFFVTPVLLISNWANYAQRRYLDPPTPHDPTFDNSTGVGRPVFLRLGVLAVVALVGLAVFAISQDSGGSVSDPDAGWVAGACAEVDESSQLVSLAPCTSTHDARIAAVEVSSAACPIGTYLWVELTDGVACLEKT